MSVLELIRKVQMIAIMAITIAPSLAHAAAPLWTITPSTPLPQEVGKDEVVTVKYKITNQSKKAHTVVMKGIPGVTATPASCSLGGNGSCEITLVIDGSKLGLNGIAGGPVVCQQGNDLQCYQPSNSDALKISPKAPPTLTDILQDLDELTEDLKIEEEDESADYQEAKGRIDGQEGLKGTPLPSILYSRVQDLKRILSEATTDEKRKEVADAIIVLQAQTQVWTANFGSNWGEGAGFDPIILQARDNLRAINDRIIDGVQKAILGKAVACTSAYDPSTHLTVTTCQ